MPDTSPRLRGSELRRLRREHQMKIAELARRMEVDPRTVTRWETAAYVPDKVVPALESIFHHRADTGTDDHEPDDLGPRLHEASHVELLAELARRIASSQDPGRDLPPVPQDRLSFPRSAGPSARRRTERPDAEGNSSS